MFWHLARGTWVCGCDWFGLTCEALTALERTSKCNFQILHYNEVWLFDSNFDFFENTKKILNSIQDFIKTSGEIKEDQLVGEGLTLLKTFELSIDLKLERNTRSYNVDVFRFEARVRQVTQFTNAKLQFLSEVVCVWLFSLLILTNEP